MAISEKSTVKITDPYFIRAMRIEKGIRTTRMLAQLTNHDKRIIESLEAGTMPEQQAYAFVSEIRRFLRNY